MKRCLDLKYRRTLFLWEEKQLWGSSPIRFYQFSVSRIARACPHSGWSETIKKMGRMIFRCKKSNTEAQMVLSISKILKIKEIPRCRMFKPSLFLKDITNLLRENRNKTYPKFYKTYPKFLWQTTIRGFDMIAMRKDAKTMY